MLRLIFISCLMFYSVGLFAKEDVTTTQEQLDAIEQALEEPGPMTLDELLKKVRQHQSDEKSRYKQREKRFLQQRDKQKVLLKKAENAFFAAQKKNNPLQKQSESNEEKLKWMREELQQHLTDLGDIHTLYSQFSGDFTARMRDSLVQTELSNRSEILKELSDNETLPDIDTMRALWLQIQEEMTLAGKISRYKARVINSDGGTEEKVVSRISTFTALSDDKILQFLPKNSELVAISRQPAGVSGVVADFGKADNNNISEIVIDPTRGSLLGILGQSPSLSERIMQGKEVGFVIITLALVGLAVALYRIAYLLLLKLKINIQIGNIENPTNTNPLGRVLLVGKANIKSDQEALQVKLDESILKELPALEKGQGLIKLLAAIAPLLGLLGTVIGMIATFQSISLFGSGDPKLMASGISQALVTTVLGLVAAIPLLFFHNIVASFSRGLIQILDEQSVGLIAKMMENKGGERAE